jgi:hypothetical protein
VLGSKTEELKYLQEAYPLSESDKPSPHDEEEIVEAEEGDV